MINNTLRFSERKHRDNTDASCNGFEGLIDTFLSAAAPIMENPPTNVTILDGKDAIMTCGAVGAPTPNVTWYRGTNVVIYLTNFQFLEK